MSVDHPLGHPPGAAGRRGPAAPPRRGRRLLLGMGLAGAGAALAPWALSGCASPASAGGPSHLRVWDPFSGGDGMLMDEMIADVSGGPDGFEIDRTILEWGPSYYTKLAMAAAGGRPPEVAVLHLSRMAGYAPGGLLDPFDLDTLAEFGITEADFVPGLWERAHHDGGLYAVPLDTHPFVVFYDTEVADRAGLLDGEGRLVELDSPEAMLAAGAALADAGGGAGVLFGHVLDPAQNWRLFHGLYAQTGATFALPDGGPPEIDADAAVRVVTFMCDLFDGRVNPNNLDYFGAMAAFNGGRGGLVMMGEWELPTLAAAGRPLGAAPFPPVFGRPGAFADSHSFVLPHQDDPDPARRREAHRYVAEILRRSLTWASAGHIPAYQPVVSEPGYRELEPQSSYVSAAESAVLDPPTWFTGAGSTFQNEMCQPLQAALLGDASPESAVEQLIDECAQLLDQPNPVV
ncbi:extracellular solute-binding protein [Streptomyces mayteni]